MNKLIIVGAGDQAKVIFSELIEDKKVNFLGFVDDNLNKNQLVVKFKNKSFYNLGKIKEVIKNKNNFSGIIGVGFNYLRKKIYKDIKKIDRNFKFQKIISKNAIINSNVKINDGTFISSGVVINTGTNIGEHCIINTSSSIDHDNIFENFSSTGPGVITGGNVNVGEMSFIGMGSVVKNNIIISNDTVVGANSFINKNCSSNYVYFGNPAKKIKKRLNNENYL